MYCNCKILSDADAARGDKNSGAAHARPGIFATYIALTHAGNQRVGVLSGGQRAAQVAGKLFALGDD